VNENARTEAGKAVFDGPGDGERSPGAFKPQTLALWRERFLRRPVRLVRVGRGLRVAAHQQPLIEHRGDVSLDELLGVAEPQSGR
jgi:hypothetical protein